MKKTYWIVVILAILVNNYAVKSADLSWNKPLLRSRFQQFILEKNLDESLEVNKVKRADEYVWENLIGSFGNIFDSTDQSNIIHHNFQKPKAYFDLSFYAGIDYQKNSEDVLSYYNYAVLLSGKVQEHLSYYANWYMGEVNELNSLSNSYALADTWRQPSDDGFYIDNLTAKIQYDTPIGDFAIGRGKFEVGSNISGSIILNDQLNDYGYFSHKLKLDNFELSFLHTTLIVDNTFADSMYAESGLNDLPNANKKMEEKHFAMHILKWNPSEELQFFAGEQVVYGGRSTDISYLLPHTFMRVTEHNLNNRDNVLIFAGMDWDIAKGNSIYANLMLDELSKTKLFTNWWANKWAFQIGDSQKFGVRDSRVTAEFTAVRPWMYTHNVLTNKYSHEDHCLGYRNGSNILQYTVELNLDLHDRYALDLQSSYSRQGTLGNNYSINYDSRTSDEASWLEGDITDTFSAGAVLTCRFNQHNTLKLGYGLGQVRGDDSEGNVSISYQMIY